MEKILAGAKGARLVLCAPVECAAGEDWSALLARCKSQGYIRVRIDGQIIELSDAPRIDARRKHQVEVVIDRVVLGSISRSRLADSIEHALALGKGVMVAVAADSGQATRFSQHLACDQCGTSYEELTPHHFSFNSRLGWCSRCEGLGMQRGTSEDAVLVRPSQSMLDGAIAGWEDAGSRPLLAAMITGLAQALDFDPAGPVSEMTREQRHALMFGLGERWIEIRGSALRFQWKGFFPTIDEATRVSWQYRVKLEELVTDVACEACRGGRVTDLPAAARLDGRTIVEVCEMPLRDAAAFFRLLKLDKRRAKIAGELLHEIRSRLNFLLDVGLGYLQLGRSAPTLSGGESQRIRLASQIGSGLTGVLYVLDEPTIGLHPRDNSRLIAALHKLRDLGNTLLMVEHDREVLESSDHIVDFGPGAGASGGRVVGEGAPGILRRAKESLTGQYLSGDAAIAVPTIRRVTEDGRVLTIHGARQNNLKNVTVTIPLGRFVCVTGVSGSGKSSLITDILYPALASRIHRARLKPGNHDEVSGLDHIDKVINVDQQPIGDSPLSNAATYTGVFDLVRELFARLPDSKVRGYTINRFSFNRPGGRCDECDGFGEVCYEMHFLPDVWVPCETCGGTRYQRETLEVRYKGKNISDVLKMPVREALEHFANVPKIRRLLQTLDDVGLGYLPLGQSAPTLSGGEAQRVKLAAELGRPQTGKTVYVLDEPTTGLHFDDLRKLLDVLHRLVDLGNSVICIEHNLDVIKTADWIIDLGPEAGDEGGRIVAEGSPEQVAGCKGSHTGRLLAPVLRAGPHLERKAFDLAESSPRAGERLVIADAAATETKMPWQSNGRRWHTEQRVSREGKPIEWEGGALAFIVSEIERLGKKGLQPTNWSDRSRVEIVANAPKGLAQSSVPWFCHFLTGGRWLLDMNVRVPAGSFVERSLANQLALKTLDDRDDIQAYGRTSRVQIRGVPNNLDDIRILVHDKKEISTSGFKSFLAAAVKKYLDHVRGLSVTTDKGTPWKRDGKTWHLSQQSIKRVRAIEWKSVDLVAFIGRVSKLMPAARVDWSGKVVVDIRSSEGGRIARVITNHADSLRVDVWTAPGEFTPTQIERLGIRQEIHRAGSSGAGISFWFQRMDHVDTTLLSKVLHSAASNRTIETSEQVVPVTVAE